MTAALKISTDIRKLSSNLSRATLFVPVIPDVVDVVLDCYISGLS